MKTRAHTTTLALYVLPLFAGLAAPQPILAEDVVPTCAEQSAVDDVLPTVSKFEFLAIYPESKPRYGYAALEMAGLLGAGTAYYVTHHDWASRDWDLETGEWGEKLTFAEGTYNLDTNDLKTNWVGHPMAGAGYCFAARHNGMSFGASYAACAAASAIWEFGPELREQWSLNDLVVTPVAGMALSEPLYRALEFRKRKSKTGIAPAGEQKTSATAEAALASDGVDADAHAVFRTGINTELRLGSGGLLRAGEWTRFAAEVGIRDDLRNDLEVLSQTALIGYYRQGENSNFLVTGGQGFKLETDAAHPTGNFAAVQVVGTHLEARALVNGTQITLGLDVSGDFAQVTSLALGESNLGLKGPEMANADSVVRDTGTYYGLGATVAPSVAIEGRDLRVGVKGDVESFSKVSAFERHPDQATEPMKIADQRGDLEVSGEWRIPRTPAWIGVDQEWSMQSGQAVTPGGNQLETVRHSSETKATLRVDF